MTESELSEPYAAHIKETRAELAKLYAQRSSMLGQIYLMEQSIAFLERHVQSILEIEQKATTNGEL